MEETRWQKVFGTWRIPGPLVWLRVIMVVSITVYPFHEVVNTITGYRTQLAQCTQYPCNYIRVFQGLNVPGTGTRVIRVQNGVPRPIFIEPEPFAGIFRTFRDVRTVAYDPNGTTSLPQYGDSDLPEPVSLVANCSSCSKKMKEALKKATEEMPAGGPWTRASSVALAVSDLVQYVVTWPVFAFIDEVLPDSVVRSRGKAPLQQISRAYTEGWQGSDSVEHVCGDAETKGEIGRFLVTGPSRGAYIWSLLGWSVFTCLHDLALLGYKPEDKDGTSEAPQVNEDVTLLLGWLSSLFLILATGACFSWSSGALSIFAADFENKSSPLCYYRLPHLQAFFALGTPCVLLSMSMSRMQSLAFSMVHGDFLYTESYKLPFKFVAVARSWRQGDSLVYDAAGAHPTSRTQSHEEAEKKEESHRQLADVTLRWRKWALVLLDHLFLAMQVSVISIAGCSITMRAGEGAVSYLRQRTSQGDVMRWILPGVFRAPSVIFVFLAFLQVFELFHHCVWNKEKRSHMRIADILRPFVIVICLSAGVVLWPGPPGNFLEKPPEVISLYQAEVWGKGGLVLFLFGISFVRTNVFGIRPVLEEMKKRKKQNKESEMEKEGAAAGLVRDKSKESVGAGDSDADDLQRPCYLPRVKFSASWHHELVSLDAFRQEKERDVSVWLSRCMEGLLMIFPCRKASDEACSDHRSLSQVPKEEEKRGLLSGQEAAAP